MNPTPPQNFNFFDAVQSGIVSLGNSTLAVLKDNAGLAIVAGLVMTILFRVMLGGAPEAALQRMILQDDTPGLLAGLLMAGVKIVLLLALQLALAMLFITRTYIQIHNASPRAFAYTLGSNEPPLFRMSQEEAMVAKATFLRLWRLWPIVIALIVIVPATQIGAEIELDRLRGRSFPTLTSVYYALYFVIIASLLWTAYRLVRLFFYMVPVAVEQGTVDLSVIKSMAPSRNLYRAVATSIFWKHIFIVALSILPIFGVAWLFEVFLDLIGSEHRGFMWNLAVFTLRHFAYLIGAVFFVGAVSSILRTKRTEEDPLPASAME